MKIKLFIIATAITLCSLSQARADIVYLKNGRSLEGLITDESEDTVELNLGFGFVKFRKSEIKKIKRSDEEAEKDIKAEWERRKIRQKQRRLEAERRKLEEKIKKEFEPKEVGFAEIGDHIIVKALINKKVNARLLLDTGATTILLSNEIAEKLNIDTGKRKADTIKVQIADGRRIDATYVILDSVSVEGAGAKNVGAVILSEGEEVEGHDGLLGMSFLNRFNFQIDTVNKKLILNKRKE